MHVQQPYLQLVAAAHAPQYQVYQPLLQRQQQQQQQQQQQLVQPAVGTQEQMLAQMLMQQPQLVQQPQLALQHPQRHCNPAGNGQLLGQLMATPLWSGQTALSSAPVCKEHPVDADAIAARVLEKVRRRVGGGKVDAATHQGVHDKDPLDEHGGDVVELKAKSAALSSRTVDASPDSVRSLASSIVDSVSDVLEEAERNRQAAERRAARAEAMAEDVQHRLEQQLRSSAPSAEAVQPEPRRLTPPQRDEGPQRCEATSAEWTDGRPQHDGTPRRTRRLQSPDTTPEQRMPERSLRLSAASKQTRAQQGEHAQVADTERPRGGPEAAAIGRRVPRHQRVADLQSWIVDVPVQTKQQGTQTVGNEYLDELTPVSRMKKLMEAVAAAEEKARVMGDETARAREECQTAKARSASMVEQHDELKAMLAADAQHAQSLLSQELTHLKASAAAEKARSAGALEQLQLAQSKVAEMEDTLMRERQMAVTERSEMHHETELATRSVMLKARESWEQERRQLEASLQEARQELIEKQRAQSVADGTVAQLTEEVARVGSCVADAQTQKSAAKTELATETSARQRAQAEAERAMGEEAILRDQVSALHEKINAQQEQLEGMRHEMQVKDIQAERKRRALLEANAAAVQKMDREAEVQTAEIQRLSRELEDERERRQTAEQALSTAAARSRQMATEAVTLSTPAKSSPSISVASPALVSGGSSGVPSGHSPAGGHTPAAMDDLKAAFSELRRQTAEAEQAKAAAADAGAACEWLGQQLAATEAQLQHLKDHLREQQPANAPQVQRAHVRGAAAMVGAINQWSDAAHIKLHHVATSSNSLSPSPAATLADRIDETGTPVPSPVPVPVPAPMDLSGGFDVSPISKHRPESKGRRERRSTSESAAKTAAIKTVAATAKAAKEDTEQHKEGVELEAGGMIDRELSLGLRGGPSVAAQFRARRRRGKAHQ